MKGVKNNIGRESRSASVKRRTPPRSDVSADTFRQLATEPISQLRDRYIALFGEEPPATFGSDILRRTIAHEIQQSAFGGLSGAMKKLLVKAWKARASGLTETSALPRKIKVGSELVREWKGKSYRVVVTAKGFCFDGKDYAGLSEIASDITGTNWNGPRFFGLRSADKRGPIHGK